ncbi:MAG TPA: Kdo hydroxylase family protein, partial [Oxalicibacterium sp.]|nr:Kdo hydroxylase family protein [Oxalicibacterium sp.]
MQILTVDADDWKLGGTDPSWIAALEAGKVLYFPRLAFRLTEDERRFLHPDINAEGSRSITLEAGGRFKGTAGDAATQAAVAAMVGRFRANAEQLVESLLPHYRHAMRMATTSYRPKQVETRTQTWRADDKRLHVDAFAGRPNHGERI